MTRFFSEGQISFTSKYDGQTVTGLVGSSVNFTWSLSGDIDLVNWGLKEDGVSDLETGGILVTIKRNGEVSVPAPSAYSGRVSGVGDVSSGQVIFTLSSIRKSDERYYGCTIDKTTDFDPPTFDSVYLAVRESTCEAEALDAMEKCIADVRSWTINDKLMLNDEKTEFLVIGTSKQLSKVSVSSIRVGDVDVIPVYSAKNLGSWLDSHMDMATHITKTCGSAFFYLYNIRHIRKYLTSECTEKLIHAFITKGAISFTKEPDNPSYVTKGNNVTLVWDYAVTDRKAELKAITWGVYISNMFKLLIAELKNGDRVVKSDMPPAYTERVDIEGRASLVIENITDQDNTFFQCTLRAEPTSGLQIRTSTVKLIVRVSQLQFISPYNGNKVTATLGSSANFTWIFSGENVKLVQWGTKKNGALSFQNLLVSIDKVTTVTTIKNSPYSGRVSAVWNGSSPGLVTFTLDSIQMADERLYICRLGPDRLDVASVYDTVQ
ncbi:hypothetical protein ACROYT_G028474 [Oculina patagonica]